MVLGNVGLGWWSGNAVLVASSWLTGTSAGWGMSNYCCMKIHRGCGACNVAWRTWCPENVELGLRVEGSIVLGR